MKHYNRENAKKETRRQIRRCFTESRETEDEIQSIFLKITRVQHRFLRMKNSGTSRVYKTVIHLIATYGSEVWVLIYRSRRKSVDITEKNDMEKNIR